SSAASSPKPIFLSFRRWAWRASLVPALRWMTLLASFAATLRRAMLESLLERFRRGDRRALARLLTLVARGEHLAEVAAALRGAGCQPAEPAAGHTAAGWKPAP